MIYAHDITEKRTISNIPQIQTQRVKSEAKRRVSLESLVNRAPRVSKELSFVTSTMGADAVGPVPAPPRLAANPVGMSTKVTGSPQKQSMPREPYNALRRQLPASDPRQLRSVPPSYITKVSCAGRREMPGETRESCCTVARISRTGVYLNEAEVTRTLHPLQAYTQQVTGNKIDMSSNIQLGKPLSAPPPLPRHFGAIGAGATACARDQKGMFRLKTPTISLTPLVKPMLKPKQTQTLHRKLRVCKATQRCKYNKPSTTNVNGKEGTGIPKVCLNGLRGLSDEQRLFLEVAAKLNAHSEPHLIKDDHDE